ncbi:inositol 1,4,5-trisphosphate receptor-interacting protein-like 1 [Geospiza fortis]|uniref:Inositol 1,4,5-trisphosphate receptor-interacting protein-like 1 n=1 Tax=Geospiza fortis TaxID=48883 RepID=A0A6I9Z9X4_GEOFO|nr:inositol 1,4,5-trisphosphate receptor-interacting protein-like 1 [Geospiza fortis]
MLLESLIQYVQPVGDVLDEEKHLRMELRGKRLERKRIRLEQQVEQLTLKQSGGAWGDLLCFALQPWQVWTVAELLILLLGLYFSWKKRSDEAENSSDRDKDHFSDNDLKWLLDERIQWPVQDLQRGCERTIDLMDNYTVYFGHILSNSFYPVLQRAIGVGSAFEGWSPREQDVVYRVLIPMTPPRGHSFHLELDSAGQRHVRNFRVRVQLECTCTREQQAENMLCFLHHPEEELRRNQGPSLLHTLCTSSYLDVQKTARWFYQLVRAIWPALPPSYNWHLKYFLRRLGDINVNLRRCLEEKCLKHFIIGNKRLPQEISLPLDIASAQPPNLFHHLAWYPVAHSQAMSEYRDLRRRLASVLLNGY